VFGTTRLRMKRALTFREKRRGRLTGGRGRHGTGLFVSQMRTRGPLLELFSFGGRHEHEEVDMPLEPNECRLHALTCERLAQRSTSPIARGAYANLAKKWLKEADDLQAVKKRPREGILRRTRARLLGNELA